LTVSGHCFESLTGVLHHCPLKLATRSPAALWLTSVRDHPSPPSQKIFPHPNAIFWQVPMRM